MIPVYNSTRLPELAERIERTLTAEKISYEILLVDDASPNPAVWPQLETLARARAPVRVLQLSRNFGQQAATLCGLREARGDWAITMDDDLQHLPEDLPKFLALREWDIVIGQFERKQHGRLQRLTSRLKGIFDRIIIGKPPSIQLSAYRMLNRLVVDGVLAIRTSHPFIPAMMFHVSKKVAGVAVRHGPRQEGCSGYTFWKRLALFSNLLINNSALVLRWVGYFGMSCSLVSFAYAASIIYKKLVYGSAVLGWASLMVAVLLIGGVLLFGLGVIGEYLVRIIAVSEEKPMYFVRRRLGGPPTPPASESPTEQRCPAVSEESVR
ncbi:MAG: glycosyltransferase family 2 protein [Candidatus Competibacter sp.]|nr:glycosyltransferase family 2 protein [Candidatus Competibacter sp.]